MLKPAAAGGAIGHAIVGQELGHERLDVEAGAAVEAGGLACRAVELEHAAAAGQLVQSVDVLRDDAADAAGRFPMGKHAVAGVGLGRAELAVHLGFLPPVFVPGVGAFEELVEKDRAIPGPHAARRAEVGDAALGADAGAGQDDGRSRRGQPMGDALDIRPNMRHERELTTEARRPRREIANCKFQ